MVQECLKTAEIEEDVSARSETGVGVRTGDSPLRTERFKKRGLVDCTSASGRMKNGDSSLMTLPKKRGSARHAQ